MTLETDMDIIDIYGNNTLRIFYKAIHNFLLNKVIYLLMTFFKKCLKLL